jgi:hypothetical protein
MWSISERWPSRRRKSRMRPPYKESVLSINLQLFTAEAAEIAEFFYFLCVPGELCGELLFELIISATPEVPGQKAWGGI